MITEGTIVKNELHDRIREIEREHNIKFSNTQKVLLSIEGSISAILDVLYGTVSIFVIKQNFKKADSEKSKLLNIDEDDEIYEREALIHGRGRPMIFAGSYIPVKRCRKEAQEDLNRGKISVGRILKKYDIETRREIKSIYIEKPNATLKELFNTSEDFISREYLIIENSEILMWTKESFPVSYFSKEI